jgi:hypothetical protein
VLSGLVVAVVMMAFDGGVLNGAVHPLDLTVGPGMIGFCEPMLDAVCEPDTIEQVDALPGDRGRGGFWAGRRTGCRCGQHGVDLVGHGLGHLARDS